MDRRPVVNALSATPAGLRSRRLLRVALFAALLSSAAVRSDHALAVTAEAKGVEERGYARIVLTFDKMPTVETKTSNGILVMKFSEPVKVPIDRLSLSIANYISVARRDPDGLALRFALSRKVTVHSMEAGEQLFIDLLPDTWTGEPPSLPQDVLEELTSRAREAKRLMDEEAARRALAKPTPIDVRASAQPTFSRLTFDLTAPVPVSLERKGDEVTLVFDAALSADLRKVKAELPPHLDGIEVEEKDARLKVTMSVSAGTEMRAFWDGPTYAIDLSGNDATKSAAELPDALKKVIDAATPAGGGTVLPATPAADGGDHGSAEAPAKAADHGTAPAKPVEPKAVEAKPADVKATEEKHADTGHAASEAGDPKGSETKSADASHSEGAPPQPAAADAVLAAKPAELASGELASVEAKPTDARVGAGPQDKAVAADPGHGAAGGGHESGMRRYGAADPAAGAPPEMAKTEPKKEAPPKAVVAEKASPVTKPAVEAPSDQVRPIIQTVGDTVRIAFPFERRTPGAVYRRGNNLWLVFDSEKGIDPKTILAQAGDVVDSAESIPTKTGAVLKLKLKKSPLTTVSPDGFSWIVSIGDQILTGALPVPLTRLVRSNGRTAVTAALEGVGTVHRIDDPEAGDTVLVVTAAGPARGFLKPQEFVEFRTLVTAHGLAFIPRADDVVVAPEIDRVVISRDGGLTLSAANAKASAPTKGLERRIALLDVAQWEKEAQQPFRQRERELLHAAADATERERTPARLALARFYLAKGFGAEATATLETAAALDANTGRNPEFVLLEAAARISMGRGADAIKMLADSGLAGSPDGALWRSLADAADHRWGPAREAFQLGSSALGLYPASLQAPFRLAAYEAALEADDAADAESQKKAFEDLKVPDSATPHKALLDARLSEMQGLQAEALERYRNAIEGKDAVVAAEARLRSITLRRNLGQVDDKAVIDELETLAATWRGDEIEARTLKSLAEEHLKAGRYRDAFSQLKTALVYHPKSEVTRQLQSMMTDTFVALFLDGEAKSMPPVDALALFYDYSELTPVDRRGDEMIRKLADRLVEVDLLDQAAELLQHQIDNRLSGAGRAQVAARLALIQLLNRKPALALQALASTRQPDLPRELSQARLIIEARALAETARPDLALEILDQIDSSESKRLKADVLWQARRWTDAGEAIETLLGSAWEAGAPLTDDERVQVMRAAIAYSLAEDKIGLDRLRTKYTAKMANSADAAGFEILSAPVDVRGVAFRDLAKQIASSDTLDAFVKEYRARHDPPAEAPAGAAPAEAAPKPAAAVDGAAKSG